MIEIVCYTGGTCGDLIANLIDPGTADITRGAVKHPALREQLKKPHLFETTEQKDQYLIDVSKQYASIPSHDLAYHIARKHNFISITVDDGEVALWAATRFKDLHRPHVWKEMTQACGANTIEDYAQILIDYSRMVRQYTNRTVQLESIVQGTVLPELEQLIGRPILPDAQEFYQQWLNKQQNLKYNKQCVQQP